MTRWKKAAEMVLGLMRKPRVEAPPPLPEPPPPPPPAPAPEPKQEPRGPTKYARRKKMYVRG